MIMIWEGMGVAIVKINPSESWKVVGVQKTPLLFMGMQVRDFHQKSGVV